MSPFANDPYCYPGTDVLINRAGLRVQAELNKFESDAVFLALPTLRTHPIKGPFNSQRLKETHRRIFGGVFPWAGGFRHSVGIMTKNRSGFVVAYGPSENVPGALDATFAALKAENDLKGLDPAKFAVRLAYYYGELDAIHAFREGNSRTLRAFTSDLAAAAGHRLNWSRTGVSKEDQRRLYHARDVAVMRGVCSELAAIIEACLEGS